MKLTRRGRVVIWVAVLALMIFVSQVDAMWWSENSLPIR